MADLTCRHEFSHCSTCCDADHAPMYIELHGLRKEADELRKQLSESQAIAADYEREIKDLKRLVDKTFNEKDGLAAEVERLREAAQAVINGWSHPFIAYQPMNELKDALKRMG